MGVNESTRLSPAAPTRTVVPGSVHPTAICVSASVSDGSVASGRMDTSKPFRANPTPPVAGETVCPASIGVEIPGSAWCGVGQAHIGIRPVFSR
jgi:hypothetical protein